MQFKSKAQVKLADLAGSGMVLTPIICLLPVTSESLSKSLPGKHTFAPHAAQPSWHTFQLES